MHQPEVNPDSIYVVGNSPSRYDVLELISWWKQDVVRGSTILVVGAGALGNEVLKNLALMGVGKIIIVDYDVIEIDNLSRSVLFTSIDSGKSKSEAAANAIKKINPEITVRFINADIVHDIGLGIYRRVDMVVGCLDNREARLAVNQACWHVNKPWIDGAIQELIGTVKIFRANHGACYECTLTDEDYRLIGIRKSCQLIDNKMSIEGKIPTTPTIASIIGGLQAQEALKILHGIQTEYGFGLFLNGMLNSFFRVEYKERHECPSHWIFDNVIELRQAKSNKTSLESMMEYVHSTAGKEAVLEIPTFAKSGFCRICNKNNAIMRPLHTLNSNDIMCPNCSNEMAIDSINTIKGDEDFLSQKLSFFGIPPLDILPARTPNWDYYFYELSGDVDEVLAFD